MDGGGGGGGPMFLSFFPSSSSFFSSVTLPLMKNKAILKHRNIIQITVPK